MVRTFFSVFIVLGLSVLATAGESQLDSLPLGESDYRYELVKIEAGQIYNAQSGNAVQLSEMVEAALESDVFVIGEFHDNMDCHLFQKQFIRALFQRNPRIIVGFEFFNREDNPALQQWSNGEISEEELLKKTGWYDRTALNYGYTRVVMDLLRELKIPATGLNVPREIVRTVSRKGFESLSDKEKELFPLIDVANQQHRYLIKTVFGDFATQVPMWFENVYTAQKCWDVVMAESMRQILNRPEFRGYKGIIIAGNFHVAYGLGIPFRYQRAQDKIRITTMVPVALGSEEETSSDEPHPMKKMFEKQLSKTAVFSRGIGDYVFSVSIPEQSHFPELGITCKIVEGSFQVTRVQKKSFAEDYGIKKGDIITSIDGSRITSLEQLRLILAQKKWDGAIRIGLEKGLELKRKSQKKEIRESDSP